MEGLIHQETLILAAFPHFSTKCELLDDIEAQHALDTMVKELTELLQSNVLRFLKNVTENNSFRAFMSSYLTHRSRPYATRASAKSPLQVRLLNLDKLMLAVLFRLISPIREYRKIEQFATKSKVSVFKGDQEQQSSISTSDLDSQYQQLLQALPFFRAIRIMDMVAIIGHSNAHISSMLLQQLLEMRPVILNEFTLTINEMNTVTRELFVTCLPLATKQSNIDINVVYLSEFAADIAVSLSLFIDAIPDRALLESQLFCPNTASLSEQYGSKLYDVLYTIYEGIVPLLSSLPASLGDKGQHFLKMTRLSCAKILQRFVRVALAGSNGKAGYGDGDQLEEVAWFDILSSKLNLATLVPSNNSAIVNESLLAIGSFLLDYVSKMPDGREEMAQLLLISLGDRETVDMLLDSIAPTSTPAAPSAAPSTAAVPSSAPFSAVLHSSTLSTASAAAYGPSLPATVSQEQLTEKIANIKAMFPDLGEAFIEACLRFYHMHDEEVIDALLSDNLHPKLRSLDRSAKAIWSGKHKTDLAMNFGSKINVNSINQNAGGSAAAETVDIFAHRANKCFVESQKDFIRRIEEKQREDAQIIDREYDDDYDDQMDDLISKKDTSFDDESTSLPSQQQQQQQQKSVDWKQQMSDIRRYNTLLKEEEKEIAFWEGMRNTNYDTLPAAGGSHKWRQTGDEHDKGSTSHAKTENGKAPVNAKDGAALTRITQQQPQQQGERGRGGQDSQHGRGGQQQGGRGGSNSISNAQRSEGTTGKEKEGTQADTSSSGDNKKKPRTKQFDKHHQRDKALRKLGPFG